MSELPEYIQIMRVYNFLGAHLTSLKMTVHTRFISKEIQLLWLLNILRVYVLSMESEHISDTKNNCLPSHTLFNLFMDYI